MVTLLVDVEIFFADLLAHVMNPWMHWMLTKWIHNKSSNYTIPTSTMKLTNFAISRRVSILRNTVLDTTLKEIDFLPLFKVEVKQTRLSCYNELLFF